MQSRVQLYVEFAGARSALSESLRIGAPLPEGFLIGLQTGGAMPLFTWVEADAYCQSHGGSCPKRLFCATLRVERTREQPGGTG